MKRCASCDAEKPLTEFDRDSRRPDGRQSYCKPCRAARYPADPARTAAYRATHRANLRLAQTRRYRKHRARLTALKLTLSCVDCGWRPATEADTARLEFDHVDPDTKHSYGGGSIWPSWSWDRIERELALCVPRCTSCHVKRTRELRHNLRRRPQQERTPL